MKKRTSSLSLSRRDFMAASGMMGLSSLLLPSSLWAAADSKVDATIVSTPSGRLRGISHSGLLSYKGIPYAASTAGSNRFRAPQPMAAWSGIRNAVEYGPLCPQIDSTLGFNDPIFSWYYQNTAHGEDCLVLNVFTPDLNSKARRPVLFYIHGGGYINGGGGGTGLDGGPLARYGDVVVVTINHRLNAFGYTALSHRDPEFADAANAGHLDIVAALRWVRDNIEAFGGDPANVTLFGQSGGGSKIMILLGMPEARGLFHKAISMSGAAGLEVDQEADMVPYVDALLKELDVVPSMLQKLQQTPVQALLDARNRAIASSGLEGARPVIDGRHILYKPMSPLGLAVQAGVPLLLGHTRTEATLFFRGDMRNFHLTEVQMRARMSRVFGIDDAKIKHIMAAYRESEPAMTPSDILVAVASDVQFRLPLENAALTKNETPGQAPAYLYNFAWTIPAMNGVLGAPHAVDIPFAFGTMDAAGGMVGTGDGPMETSMNLMAAFVAFARQGNPNNSRMPQWQPYDRERRLSMIVDANCQSKIDWRGAARDSIADLKIDPFNRAALYRYAE